MDADRAGLLSTFAAERWGERTAVRLGEESLSFTELHDWAEVTATAFFRGGVGPGDRVFVLLPNCLEVLVAQLAAWRIGAVAVPVVAIYRAHEVGHILKQVHPQVVVTAEHLADRDLRAEIDDRLTAHGLAPALKLLVGDKAADGWTTFPDRGGEVDRTSLPEPAAADAECLRLYTSGTTAAPKGAMLSSETVVAGAQKFHTVLGLNADDVGLALAPVTHIAGMLAACLVPLTCGAGAIVLPRWEVTAGIEAIARHRITWSLGAAVFLKDMVEAYESMPERGHVLGCFVSGGASTAPELIVRADALGMRAMRTYGMTETAGPATLCSRDAPLERRAHADGAAIDDLQIRIVDDAGTVLPAGVEGRILVRGVQLMLGYTDPAVTASQVVDGWFDTGDLGVLDEAGWIRITGRTKDIINRGGEKLSAADIEAALGRHPDVAAVAVTAVPHERLGETVGAFLVARPGAVLVPDELAAFLTANGLAKVKVPQEWHLLDSLPTTATGKVQKHLLAEAR